MNGLELLKKVAIELMERLEDKIGYRNLPDYPDYRRFGYNLQNLKPGQEGILNKYFEGSPVWEPRGKKYNGKVFQILKESVAPGKHEQIFLRTNYLLVCLDYIDFKNGDDWRSRFKAFLEELVYLKKIDHSVQEAQLKINEAFVEMKPRSPIFQKRTLAEPAWFACYYYTKFSGGYIIKYIVQVDFSKPDADNSVRFFRSDNLQVIFEGSFEYVARGICFSLKSTEPVPDKAWFIVLPCQPDDFHRRPFCVGSCVRFNFDGVPVKHDLIFEKLPDNFRSGDQLPTYGEYWKIHLANERNSENLFWNVPSRSAFETQLRGEYSRNYEITTDLAGEYACYSVRSTNHNHEPLRKALLLITSDGIVEYKNIWRESYNGELICSKVSNNVNIVLFNAGIFQFYLTLLVDFSQKKGEYYMKGAFMGISKKYHQPIAGKVAVCQHKGIFANNAGYISRQDADFRKSSRKYKELVDYLSDPDDHVIDPFLPR